MEWMWRGEYHPLSKSEYTSLKTQLEYNAVSEEDAESGRFADLPHEEQVERIKKRVKGYCQRVRACRLPCALCCKPVS